MAFYTHMAVMITSSKRNPTQILRVTVLHASHFTGTLQYALGLLFHWKARQQPLVAQSTCEAEYVAGAQAAQDANWIRNLLRELGFEAPGPTNSTSTTLQRFKSLSPQPQHDAASASTYDTT